MLSLFRGGNSWLIYLNEKKLCAIGRTIAARNETLACGTSIPIGMDGWLTTFKSLDISAMALYPVPKPKFHKRKRKNLVGISAQKFGKVTRIENEPYKEWIKTLKCEAGGIGLPSDPHHVNKPGYGGVGTKTDDTRCIPLAHPLHQELHQTGSLTFAKKYGLNYEEIIERLNEIWQTIGK